MATPPQLASFTLEDFADAPEWFKRFLVPFNEFATSTVNCLAGGIDQKNNLVRKKKQIQIVSYASSLFPLKFTNDLGSAPYLVQIAQVLPQTAGDTLSSSVSLVWRINAAGQIQIDNITGLNSGKQYLITVTYE